MLNVIVLLIFTKKKYENKYVFKTKHNLQKTKKKKKRKQSLQYFFYFFMN